MFVNFTQTDSAPLFWDVGRLIGIKSHAGLTWLLFTRIHLSACARVQVIWLTIGTNGGLKSLTAQGQELVLLSYHGNSGLLATKSIQIGWTTFYESVSHLSLFVLFCFSLLL